MPFKKRNKQTEKCLISFELIKLIAKPTTWFVDFYTIIIVFVCFISYKISYISWQDLALHVNDCYFVKNVSGFYTVKFISGNVLCQLVAAMEFTI